MSKIPSFRMYIPELPLLVILSSPQSPKSLVKDFPRELIGKKRIERFPVVPSNTNRKVKNEERT